MLPSDYPLTPWVIMAFALGAVLMFLGPKGLGIPRGAARTTIIAGFLTCLSTMWLSSWSGLWAGMVFWARNGCLFGGAALMVLGSLEQKRPKFQPTLVKVFERLLAIGLGGFWVAVVLMSVMNGYPLAPAPGILMLLLALLLLGGRHPPERQPAP